MKAKRFQVLYTCVYRGTHSKFDIRLYRHKQGVLTTRFITPVVWLKSGLGGSRGKRGVLKGV